MRQEQSRSKTPAARILSLALALCMIAAFVPAFTLTAGAADSYNSTEYAIAANIAFDGSYSAVSNTPSSGNAADISGYYFNEDGTAWTQQFATLSGSSGDAVDPDVTWSTGQAYIGGVEHRSFASALEDNTEASRNIIKFQHANGTGTGEYGKITMGNGYGADSDVIIFQWIDFNTYKANAEYGGVVLHDLSGNTVAQVFLDWYGGTYYHGDSSYKEKTTMVTGTVYRISLVNDSDANTYDVYYEAMTASDSSFQMMYSSTDNEGQVNGIGDFILSRPRWNDSWKGVMGIGDLKIYTADFATASTEGSVQIALDEIDNVPVRADEETGSFDLDSTVTDSYNGTFNVTWTSDSAVITVSEDNATATVVPTDEVTYVTLTPTVQFDEDTTVTGTAHTVVVFPASRAGSTYSDGTASYDIGSENIIETKGTKASFENESGFSTVGWTNAYDGAQLVPDDDVSATNYFWRVTETSADSYGTTVPQTTAIPDGDYALGTRWNDRLGYVYSWDKGLCSIHTAWDVEGGKTYYFSFYALQNDDSVSSSRVVEAYFTATAIDNSGETASTTINDDATQIQTFSPSTEWAKYECIFTPESDGYIAFCAYYLGNSSNSGAKPYNIFDDFELYEATQKEETLVSVNNVTAAVISGTEPVLPNTVTGEGSEGNTLTESVTWDAFTENQFVNDTTAATTTYVDGTSASGFKVTATVTVLPLSYTLDSVTAPISTAYSTTDTAQYISFLDEITGEAYIELEYTPNGLYDNWIYINNGSALWGSGQIGIGTGQSDTSILKAQYNSGAYNAIGTIEDGNTYRLLIHTDVSQDSDTYTVVMSDLANNTVGSEVTQSYRTNASQLDRIVFTTNGSATSFTLSNIKVYDPNVVRAEYTVKYVDTEGNDLDTSLNEANDATGVYTTIELNTLGYDGEEIVPYVDIPYFTGYIIKSKSVDTDNNIVTLTYEAVQEDNFFGDADETATVISLNMLGAHDAFTSNTSAKGDSAQIQCDGSSTSSTAYAAYYGSNVIGASQAQSLDALDLLHAGVRYFDIRLSRSENTATASGLFGVGSTTVPSTNGVFYTTHALLSDEFRTIAYTLSQWAAQHPNEVLILDFQALFDDGSASSTSWSDLADLLDEAGLTDYVVISESVAGSSGSHPLKSSTIADVTENGAHAGVLLFAQTTGSSAESSTFIERRGGTNSDIFSGRLYSNYSDCTESIDDEFSAAYIQSQVDYQNEYTSGDHSIYWQARVMQAQTELTSAQILAMYTGSNYSLLSLAETSNAALYEALTTLDDTDDYSYSTWLTALPIVMINGVGDDTTEALVALLKAQNVKQDVTVNYTCGDTTITKTEQLMVGTIYTKDQYAIVHDDTNGNYYVNNAYKTSISDCTLGDIVRVPSPSSASGATIEIPVTEIGDSIYSIGYRTYATNVEVSDGGVLYSSASAVGSAADNPAFSAYNWSTFDNTDRVGVAIMTAPEASAIEKYTLDVTNARDYSTGGLYTYFYIVTLDEYNSIDISDSAALETLFDDDNLIATYNNSANNNNTDGYTKSFELDKETLDKYANQEVVILGTSSGGLYGLSSISIGTSEMDYGVNLYVGAQIRVGSGMGTDPEDTENYQELLGDSGLRFIATVDTTNTVAAEADKDLELDDGTFGMNVGIAIFNGGTDTAEFAASAETCTADNLIATIPAKKYQYTGENGSDYVFTAAITNIKESNYNRIYVAVPYVVVGGETYYNYAGAVARTPYQVAKGILVDSDTTTGYNYEADADMLVNVLNVYTNKTGARITLTGSSADEYSVVEMTYANGATAFFTASGETQSDGSYVITIAPIADTEAMFYDYADQYYRVNNARSAFETALNAEVELVSGNLVITIPASE